MCLMREREQNNQESTLSRKKKREKKTNYRSLPILIDDIVLSHKIQMNYNNRIEAKKKSEEIGLNVYEV